MTAPCRYTRRSLDASAFGGNMAQISADTFVSASVGSDRGLYFQAHRIVDSILTEGPVAQFPDDYRVSIPGSRRIGLPFGVVALTDGRVAAAVYVEEDPPNPTPIALIVSIDPVTLGITLDEIVTGLELPPDSYDDPLTEVHIDIGITCPAPDGAFIVSAYNGGYYYNAAHNLITGAGAVVSTMAVDHAGQSHYATAICCVGSTLVAVTGGQSFDPAEPREIRTYDLTSTSISAYVDLVSLPVAVGTLYSFFSAPTADGKVAILSAADDVPGVFGSIIVRYFDPSDLSVSAAVTISDNAWIASENAAHIENPLGIHRSYDDTLTVCWEETDGVHVATLVGTVVSDEVTLPGIPTGEYGPASNTQPVNSVEAYRLADDTYVLWSWGEYDVAYNSGSWLTACLVSTRRPHTRIFPREDHYGSARRQYPPPKSAQTPGRLTGYA